MNIKLPTVPSAWSPAFGNVLVSTLQRAFPSIVSRDEETPRIVLRSPNGTLYTVTVSDAGVLVVTLTTKPNA